MRTVHETEALRPSDPVPKHHSSNPSNKFQRIKLVLSNEAKRPSESKGSTPASPSSLHPPPSSTLQPSHGDADHVNNNITYIQDLASPGAPTMVQFPPDLSFTPAELALPADKLFLSLRRTLQFATEEGDALRDVLGLEGEEPLDGLDAAEHDILPSRRLGMAAREGKLSWWRDEEWTRKLAGAQDLGHDVVRTKEPVL